MGGVERRYYKNLLVSLLIVVLVLVASSLNTLHTRV